jgi:hypothetical protein
MSDYQPHFPIPEWVTSTFWITFVLLPVIFGVFNIVGLAGKVEIPVLPFVALSFLYAVLGTMFQIAHSLSKNPGVGVYRRSHDDVITPDVKDDERRG